MVKDILLFRFLYLIVAFICLLHLQTEEITPWFYLQPADSLTNFCSFSGLPEKRKVTGARQCNQSCQDIFLIPCKWQAGGMVRILPRNWHLPQANNMIWLVEVFWAQVRFVTCSYTSLGDNARFHFFLQMQSTKSKRSALANTEGSWTAQIWEGTCVWAVCSL